MVRLFRTLAGALFFDKLQNLLVDAGFDRSCKMFVTRTARLGSGATSAAGRLFPNAVDRLFRKHLSHARVFWRYSDSLSLRQFRRLKTREKVLDNIWSAVNDAGARRYAMFMADQLAHDPWRSRRWRLIERILKLAAMTEAAFRADYTVVIVDGGSFELTASRCKRD